MTIRNNSTRLLLAAAVIAVLALVALCLVLLIRTNQNQEFKQQAVQNCRQINVLKSAIRAAVDESQRTALNRAGLEPVQRQFIIEYYERQRDRFRPDDCQP